jgi:hypothetical protein
MNDRIRNQDDVLNAVVELRLGRDSVELITGAQVRDEAITKFRTTGSRYLIEANATIDMLTQNTAEDRADGYLITRDSLGTNMGMMVSHAMRPGLNRNVLLGEWNNLVAGRYVNDQGGEIAFNLHDEDAMWQALIAVQQASIDLDVSAIPARDRKLARINHAKAVADVAPNLFVFAELIKQSEIIIRQQYTKLHARSMFPVLNLNTWLEIWRFTRYDESAVEPAQPIDMRRQPGRLEGARSEEVVPILRPLRAYARGARWDQIELWRLAEAVANGAMSLGQGLSITESRTKRAIDSLLLAEDNLAFFGDANAVDNSLIGVLSPTGVSKIPHVPAAVPFGGGDAEDDRKLLLAGSTSIALQTEKEMAPDTVALGTESFLYITEARYGDLSNASSDLVIDEALKTLRMRGINTITWCPPLGYRPDVKARYEAQGLATTEAERLAGGIAGEHCMLVYKKDPETMAMVVGKDVTPYPSQSEVLGETEVRYCASFGAMAIFQPATARVYTNVGPIPAP